VRSGENAHQTQPRPEAEGAALPCMGRMVQPLRPPGFHRLRDDGRQATCNAKQVQGVRTAWRVALGQFSKGTSRITARPTSRERVLASTGHEPWRGARGGGELLLWQVWHPRYGVVYDEWQAIQRGRYRPGRGSPPGTGVDGDGEKAMTQLALAERLV
jgi:hypothetical protein